MEEIDQGWLHNLQQRIEHEGIVDAAAKLLIVRRRGGQFVPLHANAAQKLFEQRHRRESVVLKARQMGMSTWIAARFFLRTIARPGTVTLQVAHTREAAENLFAMVRRMWSNLPQELREGPLRLSKCNSGLMEFARTSSEFRVGTAGDENTGRGLSLQNLHCSEVSRWPGDAKATLAGLRAALAPGGECVLESTANGAYGAFYDEWRSAEARGVARHFFPWWMEPAYVDDRCVPLEAMTAEEAALVTRHTLTGFQIGYRRKLQADYGVLREQEFAEDPDTCFRATGACCFEISAIEDRIRDVPEPQARRRNGALQIWLPPTATLQYVVGVDTAGGGSDGDFAAVQVVERKTGLQCAELQERLRPAELARVVAEIAREYGGAMVAVERNNHGGSVLAYLETAEGYTRIWRDRTGEPGWLTTLASKPAMMARLGSVICHESARLKSRRLLAECRVYVSGEGGKTSAAAGEHDDLVMAMAVAESVRASLLERSARSSVSC